jgi:putative flippase GtrA
MNNLINKYKNSSIVRYVPIGFSAFLIDIILLNVGLSIHMHLLVANGFSAGIAIIYSYFMHKHFTFAHKARSGGYQIGAKEQFVIFVIVSLIGLGLNELLMGVLVGYALLGHNIAKIITSAAVFAWNYLVNYFVTFRINK